MLGTVKIMGNRMLFSLIVCASFFSNGKAQKNSIDTNIFSCYGISLGVTNYQMNFNSLKSNPYLLDKPSNIVPMPDVCFYLGDLNKLFAGFEVAGVWKNTSGTYQNYQSIRVQTAHFRSGISGYYRFYTAKKISALGFIGTSFARTYIRSRDLGLGSTGIITNFKNNSIRQNWLIAAGIMVSLFKKQCWGDEYSLGLKVGYDFPVSSAKWYIQNYEVYNEPNVSLGGPFVGIVFNAFGQKQKNEPTSYE